MDTNTTSFSLTPWLWLVVVGGLFFVAGQYIAATPERLQQVEESGNQLTVQSTGTATIKPDVAKVSMGVESSNRPSPEQALEEVATEINAVIEVVRKTGVAEDDIKTQSLNVYPQYDFDDGRQIPRGYTARQSLQVTVRELEEVGALISAVTAVGTTNISGPNFTVDDPEEIRLKAEQAAIEKARTRAELLAASLGARLGQVKSFESNVDQPIYPVFSRAEQAGSLQEDVATPELPTGVEEIEASVTVTFQLE